MDLHQCIPLLNLIDCELDKIIVAGREEFFLPEKAETTEKTAKTADAALDNDKTIEIMSTTESEECASDFLDAKALLSFSVYLLRNSINKDIYNSTEVITDIIDMQDYVTEILKKKHLLSRS